MTGIIPSAIAKDTSPRTVALPLSPDGSVTVNFAPGTVQDLNIREVRGSSTYGKLNVNIEEVDGSSVDRSIPVKINN